jgi:hypothetical protein
MGDRHPLDILTEAILRARDTDGHGADALTLLGEREEHLAVHFTTERAARKIVQNGFGNGVALGHVGLSRGKPKLGLGQGYAFAFKVEDYPDFWSEELAFSMIPRGTHALFFRVQALHVLHETDGFHQLVFACQDVRAGHPFMVMEWNSDDEAWMKMGAEPDEDGMWPTMSMDDAIKRAEQELSQPMTLSLR